MDGNTEADVIPTGAGPGGLAPTKAMLDGGLKPIVFEASNAIGGQLHNFAPRSGVWAGMNTNPSLPTTVFSDLPHLEDTPLYHDVVVDLARAAGVEPRATEYPALADEFVFGPIVPSRFRLSGHGADADGEARFRDELARLGRDHAAPLPEEVDLRRTLAAAEAPDSSS